MATSHSLNSHFQFVRSFPLKTEPLKMALIYIHRQTHPLPQKLLAGAALMCQVGVAASSAWHLSAVELQEEQEWRIWVDTDDKPPCEDDCGGVTRRDQTADRGRRRCQEGRDERQKKEKELREIKTQPNNYSFVCRWSFINMSNILL